MSKQTEEITEETVETTEEVVETAEETKSKGTKKKDPNRLVKLTLPPDRGLNAKEFQHVNVNGRDYKIPLGQEVKVPYFVYNAIVSIEKDKAQEYDYIKKNARVEEI